MKKKLAILAVVTAIIISLIMLFPSQVFAANGSLPSEDPTEDLIITVNKGDSDTPTKIKVCATDAPEGEWYYEFFILKYSGTIEELDCEPAPEDFIVYDSDGYFTIEEEDGSDCDSFSVQLGKGNYFAMVFVFEEDFNTHETTFETTGAGVGYIQFIQSNPISSKLDFCSF